MILIFWMNKLSHFDQGLLQKQWETIEYSLKPNYETVEMCMEEATKL